MNAFEYVTRIAKHRRSFRRTMTLATMALWLSWSGGPLDAQVRAPKSRGDGPPEGRSWAILVGVEKYHRATHLRHSINDVRQVAQTLRDRGGYAKELILEMVETEPNPRFQPLRASLLAQLREWLAKPGPHDRILVYFSGHGFRDGDGKLYLAPIDCDPANPTATGVAADWLRQQLGDCKAQFKLLVLDVCHAGSDKGDDGAQGVPAKELGMPFESLTGTVTLASSTGEEKSQLWEDKRQSLFSYWLNQGLKGHADWDGDSAVTIDELYDYVFRNVTHTAQSVFPRPQTPVRLFRSLVGVPVVIRVKPQGLKQLLADMAEQLGDAVQIQRLAKVGVLEFTNDTKMGELLGADFGLLGRYCAEELERRLIQRATGKFSVVDRRRVQSALKAQNFALKDLASEQALKDLSRAADNTPVIALGTLRNRVGRIVTVQCKLIRTDRDDLAGSAGGTAVLDESEWAMLGRSAAVDPDDRRPRPDDEERSVSDTVVQGLDRRSQGPLDEKFPYRVTIAVSGQAREAVMRGNDMFVPLSKGEVYEIWVEVKHDEPVMMRLLVDGLNTLPEKVRSKAVKVEQTEPSERYEPAQRVNLKEARAWLIDPKESRVVAVSGFVSELRDDDTGKYNEFRVVDAQDSLAARQQFTDQVGLITAAFYTRKAVTRGSERSTIGTAPGRERVDKIVQVEGVEPGNLLGVVHLRYVEPETLKRIQETEPRPAPKAADR